MSSYQVCTDIKLKYHDFLKYFAKENDSTISEIVKELIKKYLHEYYDNKIDPKEKDNLRMISIERIDDLKEKGITVKLGKELHKTYKVHCVERQISMKKMTRKIIKEAYKYYKK